MMFTYLVLVGIICKVHCKGVFKSHDSYPVGEYNESIHLIENVMVLPGNTIELAFVDGLDTEGSQFDNCYDWVKILDGDGSILLNNKLVDSGAIGMFGMGFDSGSTYGNVCGFYNGSIILIKSITNKISMEFSSDGGGWNGNGFQLEWREVVAPAEAPAPTSPSTGVILFPDDNSQYWKETVTVVPGNTLELTFVDSFDNGELDGDHCEDWVKILDGDGSILFDNKSAPGMNYMFSEEDGKTCGFYNGSIISIKSITNSITVHCDHFKHEKNLTLEWREVVAPRVPTTPRPIKLLFPKNGKRTVKIEKGSQVIVRSRAGGPKGAGRSEVNFKLGSTCKKTLFSCSQFNVFSRDKPKCRNGDKMIILNGKRKVFCGENKPISSSTRRSKVILVSNGKGRNPGVRCTMKCIN